MWPLKKVGFSACKRIFVSRYFVDRLGLTNQDKKELDSVIKAAVHDAKTWVGLARRIVPSQGNVEEFAYGLISGMIMGNFVAMFENKNGRQPDKDEIADLFSIMLMKMPQLRKAIMKELGN